MSRQTTVWIRSAKLRTEARLQVRNRKRKKVPVGERQLLVRPEAANEVWPMDFVFDRNAEGRVIKCLTVVDDATLAASRGLPQVIRTDNGKEFCGQAMLTWAHAHQVALRLIEPGKPNQNAYIGSFNGRLRDECLNEHWFPESGACAGRPCAGRHRGLAARVQRGATEEGLGRIDTCRLCETPGREIGYHGNRTLNRTATHDGVTSLQRQNVFQ
jgi:transposase InsO family protein